MFAKCRERSTGYGIVLGVGAGVAIGVAMDNIGVGIAVGVAIGVAFEAALRKKRPRPAGGDDAAGGEG